MIVLNRTQVTEVTTKRQISHTLEVDGVEYSRYENIIVYFDYMGIEPRERDTKVRWTVKVGERVYENLRKASSKALEVKFQELMETDRNAWNGNGRIWETYNK